MFYLHQHHKRAKLAEALVTLMREQPLPPMQAERVVVPSAAVGRWLTLDISRQLGICSHVELSYPAGFIWRLFGSVLTDIPPKSPFESNAMTWHWMALLTELLDQPMFAPVAHYLAGGDLLKQYEFAKRLSALFDAYLVYRPDWLAAWSNQELLGLGQHEVWQAALWRALAGELSSTDSVHPRLKFFQALSNNAALRALLPKRVLIFDMPAMPPPYLEMFRDLSQYIEIHAFVFNPCQEFWSLITSEKTVARAALDKPDQVAYLEVGHPLLAAWGMQGKSFLEVLSDFDYSPEALLISDDEEHVETILQQLQRDILDLQSPQVWKLTDDDLSLQVHSCHSEMREVQVLHDQLLRLFSRLPKLKPEDILVLSTNMETYAPIVEAVFGSAPANQHIPFSVAVATGYESPIQVGFVQLLALPGSRMSVDNVFDLLRIPALIHRFGLDEDDIPVLRAWVESAQIRWGYDATSKAQLGLPDSPEHTWQAGLERLLMGWMMMTQGLSCVGGVMPLDAVEGSNIEKLASLLTLTQLLTQFSEKLAAEHTISEWRGLLMAILQAFFAPSQTEEAEIQRLRYAIESLAVAEHYTAAIPLDVIVAALEPMLEDSSGGGAFLNGGVTFAAFRPLRTIPARVICLLGMNDGVLPRQMSPSGFDLMASFPRQGDRQARAEDRYLMLESVCAAQDVFYVSYVGRSIRDDSQLPPSILVAELLDCISRMTPDFKVLEHPLQPFSPRYFNQSNTQLFSYAERYAIASRAALHKNSLAPFVEQPLPPPDGQLCHVDIDELLRFYEHPAKYFLRERLGVTLLEEEDSHPDHEPFELDGLENWHLKRLLLDAMEQGLSIEETEKVARATGQLPHGRLGSSLLMKQSAVIAEFHARKQSFLADIELSQLEVDIPVSVHDLSFRISGQLSGVTTNGLITWRLSQLRSKHKLGLWIQHLLLCVLQPAHVLRQSWLIGEDDTLHFGPLSALEAETHLRDFLALYWDGLQSPLPLFAQCSWLLAEDANASKVMSAWNGQWSTLRDADDPVNALVFAELSPMSPRVIELAKRIYEPLMHALKAEA